MKFGMQLSYGPQFPLAKFQQGHKGKNTDICSEAKWNDSLHGSDVDHYEAEIIIINFALGNNF